MRICLPSVESGFRVHNRSVFITRTKLEKVDCNDAALDGPKPSGALNCYFPQKGEFEIDIADWIPSQIHE